MSLKVALVVAVADNDVIGREGGLPWHLPDDLRHFKAVTLGKPILMGRRTFESIGRPLPGRRNLVVTRAAVESGGGEQQEPQAGQGVEYVSSLEEACARARDAPELCVIGGAQLFAIALPQATRIYLTRVHAVVDGDVTFRPPAASTDEPGGWREVERSEHPPDARHAYAMSFVRLER